MIVFPFLSPADCGRARDVERGGHLACKEAEISEQSCAMSAYGRKFFYSLREAQIVIGLWQNTCNRVRPHSSLGYRPPAPVTFPDLAFRLPMAAALQ
ncbi:transposase InsO family protein [Methylorubrum extorquens]|nr:transposase InsO family protein [Methylorubrum extorquens]